MCIRKPPVKKTSPRLPAQRLPQVSQSWGKNREKGASRWGRLRKKRGRLGEDGFATQQPPQKHRGSPTAHSAQILFSLVDFARAGCYHLLACTDPKQR